MAQYTAYAPYVVYFRDEAELNSATSLVNGNGLLKNPSYVANLFGLPYPPPGGVLGDRGMYTLSYDLASPGSEIGHPLPSGVRLNPLTDFTIIPGQFGGPDLKLVWSCSMVRVGGDSEDSSVFVEIPIRRFGGGFEVADGENGLMPSGSGISRDASRTSEGLGWALRNNINMAWTRALNSYDSTIMSNKSWERFYIRIRVLPSVSVQIWDSRGFPSDGEGGRLKVDSGGTISVFNVLLDNSEILLGTTVPLILNRWYKIDILLTYNNSPVFGSGKLGILLDGTSAVSSIIPFGDGGLGTQNTLHRHVSSRLGNPNSTAVIYEIDLDDWSNQGLPKNIASEADQFESFDALAGTHWKKQWNTAFGSGNTGWTGELQSTNQMMSPVTSNSGSRLTSSTSGARIDAITDANNDQDATGTQVGIISGVVTLSSLRAGTADGTLGYRLAAATPVLKTIAQAVTLSPNSVMNQSGGIFEPINVVPFHVIHDKAASANASTVAGLQAVLEYVGTWGIADDPTTQDIPVRFLHNCYYPNTRWAFPIGVPIGLAAVVGATYVGNGTSQHINLPLPCHFLWIRPLTGDTGGVKWFGAGLGGHTASTERVIPDYVIRPWVDSLGQAKFTVTGNNSQINANGVTYQYIAFCDPVMRYNICGAYRHDSSLASAVNTLFNPNFIPTGGFIVNEVINTLSGSSGLSFKGPGHTVNAGNRLDGTNQSALATFAAGSLTTRTDAHVSGMDQGTYSLWRTNDQNGNIMVQILSYTGDGTSSKIVILTPTSGRCPLFTLVVPHGAASHFRDPSHTTNQSSNANNGAIVTTGITAIAIDQITVGTTLNSNGIIYEVFIICGGTVCPTPGTNPPPIYPPPNPPYPTDNVPFPPLYPEPTGKAPESPSFTITTEGGMIIGATAGEPGAQISLLGDISGIYTLVKDKTNDTLYDRQSGQTSINVEIPEPNIKTGYIGG